MFAGASRIYDRYKDRELKKIRDMMGESNSWKSDVKCGRTLSQAVMHDQPSPHTKMMEKQVRKRENPMGDGGSSSGNNLGSDCVIDTWKKKFERTGAELENDGLRKKIDNHASRTTKASRKLNEALKNATTSARPIFGDFNMSKLPLTEPQIQSISQEKYGNIEKNDLKDFLIDCHANALRNQKRIRFEKKLSEVYHIKEENFLKKLQIQSLRNTKSPKEPFIVNPKQFKRDKGIKIEWQSKASMFKTYRSFSGPVIKMSFEEFKKPFRIKFDSEEDNKEKQKVGYTSKTNFGSDTNILTTGETVSEKKPMIVLNTDKELKLSNTHKIKNSHSNKNLLPGSSPLLQSGSVREFSLQHLLVGGKPKKVQVVDSHWLDPRTDRKTKRSRSKMDSSSFSCKAQNSKEEI